MHRRFVFAITAILLALSPAVWALGLGEAKVLSFLNQPLEVRIDLITRPSDDLDSVSARLASAEDFAMVGASLSAISVPLDFSIEEQDGDYYILMTSLVAITDPVVRVIVEVDWAAGRMLREYTVLLDPPTFDAAAPAPVVQREPARPVQSRQPDPESPARPVSKVPAKGEYGPVRSGETLWRIATDWSQGTDLNVNQVMLAILEKNPGAFLNNNINLLRQGATLKMPEVSEIRRMSEIQARAEVDAQRDEFRDRLRPAQEELPLFADESEQMDEPAGVDDSVTDDRLELVPPQDVPLAEDDLQTAEPGADVSSGQLREELARTEEQLISEQQQNEYLKQRLSELESALSETAQTADAGEQPGQAEGAVQDADMAVMEDRLREQRQEPIPSVRTADDDESGPWYSSLTLWVGILLVAGLVGAGWYFRRRDSDAVYVSDLGRDEEEAVHGIIEEADDIKRVLDPGETAANEVEEPADDGVAEPDAPGDGVEPDSGSPVRSAGPKSRPGDDDATILDEESADPEIKLDLARAYISMGDKEAARAILEEVLEFGDEDQQAEARKMHDGL